MDPLIGTPLEGTPLAPIAMELGKAGWPLQHDEAAPALFTAFEGKNGERRAILVYEPGVERVLVYAMMVDDCPPALRGILLELLSRINYGLGVGCFEMDLDDGEIRYRMTLPAAMAMPHVVVPQLIDACMTVDTYAPTFDAVAAGTPVLAAIEALKARLQAPSES